VILLDKEQVQTEASSKQGLAGFSRIPNIGTLLPQSCSDLRATIPAIPGNGENHE
jgi:hypothetical protein